MNEKQEKFFKPDKFQLRAQAAIHPVTGEACVQAYIIVNGVKIPFCFDVHKFISALEYSCRVRLFCLPGKTATVATDIINSEDNCWVWKNHFTAEPTVWYFERDKVLRQLKRFQTQLKKLTQDKPQMRFILGESIPEVIAYKYSRPKLLWIDYLNQKLAEKLLEIKKNGWKTQDSDLAEIETLLLEGAHIYKEDRNGKRLLDKILDQPNEALRALVCKIANYPLTQPDENTVTLVHDGCWQTFRAPRRMSLREATERGFLVEQF